MTPTREQVRQEPAGVRMNLWVIDALMSGIDNYRDYSHDIAAAMEAADKAGLGMLNKVHDQWEAYIIDSKERGEAKTKELAICRAILLAKLEQNP